MAKKPATYQVIRNGRILDFDSRNIDNADILIKDDTITEIGRSGMEAPADAVVVDAKGQLVIPGLVNAHTHGQGSLAKGMGDQWSLELLLNALPWVGSRARLVFATGGGFIPWEQWTSTSMRKEDSVAQPVDWAYKSARVGDGSQGLKARGCWTTLLSHGKAKSTHYLEPSWLYGMYNIAVASEGKGWVMQVVDATAATPGYAESRDEDTIRTRVLDTGTLHKKTFGTSGNKWGSPSSAGVGPTLGTYLIDDQEVDTMATSLSVKGRNFTYMLFGFMQNRAQRIIIESSKALLRVIGGRRRRGR